MGRWLVGGLAALLMAPAGSVAAVPPTDGSVPAPAQVAREVTHVPASVLNAVGAGSISRPQVFAVFKLQKPFASEGKPEVLTMNYSWCPHCAANNWSLAIALSRFGTLSGLHIVDTGAYYCKIAHDPCSLSPFPCYPNTHGISFFGTSYKSRYISFAHVVLQDLHGHKLQKLDGREHAAVQPFDSFGAAPAVDVGGAFGFLNSGYTPLVLAHKSWSRIASSFTDAKSVIAKHVDGLANLFTAAICDTTKDKPASVCSSKGVVAAGARLASALPPPPPPPR